MRRWASGTLGAGLALCVSAPAKAVCYADPARLEAAVRVIVGSYKCDGFRQAISGKAYTLFMSRSGIIDQTTGPCQREIAALVQSLSIESVKDRAGYCQAVAAALAADSQLAEVASRIGAR